MPVLLTALMTMWAEGGPVGALHSTSGGCEIEVQRTIIATRRFSLTWQDDDLCNVKFGACDYTPELVVTDADGVRLAAPPVGGLLGPVTIVGAAPRSAPCPTG